MIANIWPEGSHIEETISTLRFASRMNRVHNEMSVNIQLDPQVLMKKYERQIRDLRLELAMHDTLVGRGRISYEPYSSKQIEEVQKIAEDYLDGKTEDIEIESIRQVKELFIQFRNIYRMTIATMTKGEPASFQKKNTVVGKDELQQTIPEADKNRVGKEKLEKGFGMGKAPTDSKPTFKMDNSLVGAGAKKSNIMAGKDNDSIEAEENNVYSTIH